MADHLAPLAPDALYHRCDPEQFRFETTTELEPLDEVLGQERALDALQFGISIRHDNYHVYALGPPGVGKHAVVSRLLEARAKEEATPPDWCYVQDFEVPHRPRALRLPAGRGRAFRDRVQLLIREVRSALPAAFESDDFRIRREAIEEASKKHQEEAFNQLQEEAQAHQATLLRTPVGMTLAPLKDGEVISPDQFHRLPEAEQKRIQADLEALQKKLEEIVRQVPQWERELRAQLRELGREVTTSAVRHLIDEVRKSFEDLPPILEHLDALERDLIESAEHLLGEQTPAPGLPPGMIARQENDRFRRYSVNLLVGHGDCEGAPVIYEDHPAFQNLLGRIEHLAQFGALVTDFNLIKPGAFHAANGGYLILDVRRVLSQPFAWDELKRTLRARAIRMESLAQTLSLVSTVSLEPEPIPLDVKVVLIGDRPLFYLLSELDPDFKELFKVLVDFADDVDRTPESTAEFARLLATMVEQAEIRALDRGAVARVVEHASRLGEDTKKLSIHQRTARDLLREADHFAARNGNEWIGRADVQAAIDSQIHRADRIRERVLEQIRRRTILIETAGVEVGQVNGLAVTMLAGFSFARPVRISARIRLGRGQVVDIEREVEFGGPIHAKGVLILEGFLGARFALERPLTLHASLVFEQSYGPVEGDSASAAELYALLSALADAPIRQSFAVTGSVSQHGHVQAVGGINEKIEGFFDVCREAGLNGEQGVLIPSANVQHLMLREDVIDAVREERFRIFPVESIDQGIELLTGSVAGVPGPDGAYPEGTINQRVEARLARMADVVRRFGGRDERDRG